MVAVQWWWRVVNNGRWWLVRMAVVARADGGGCVYGGWLYYIFDEHQHAMPGIALIVMSSPRFFFVLANLVYCR